MKGMLGTAGAILLALAALPASAGTLYLCVGEDGVSNYVNKKVPGSDCRVFKRYAPDRRKSTPARKAAPAPAVAKAAAPSATPRAAEPAMIPAAVRSPGVVPAALPVASAGKAQRRVNGQVYSYMKDGVRHFTSQPPRGGASGVRTIAYSYIETCYACGVRPGVSFATVRLNTVSYQAEIAAAAREFGVEEAIVRAIIHAESAFNPTALSHAGAQGLMQLMPATARRFGVADSYDAGQNIRGGVQYLAWLLKRFNGDLTLAAAGYNAGEGAVDRHKGVPPYSETQRYVQRVGMLAERYRGVQAAR
jgi:soluble lytic murein transglycosylase-like protein